jgi:hypothetical protein
MNPRYPIREVMKRTAFNLEFIDARAAINGPYETVQLVNSFLGAFVHVKERFQRHIPASRLPAPGWPVVDAKPPYAQPSHLRELVRLIRNSVAHGNIEFIAAPSNRIASVRLWNECPGSRRKNWEADIGEPDLRKLLACFIELMSPILKKYET